MVRRLGICLCLVGIIGFTALPAFAAVQNVKVSGDVTTSAVYRDNLDLDSTEQGTGMVNFDIQDKESDFLSIARVRVDADLTDNVSATVRLLNERNWNGDSTAGVENNRNIGFSTANTASREKQTDLDLAYVTLKEFLYSPLTVAIGRQNLRFGNGWVVGDPDTNGIALTSTLAEGDLSARKSFDAIRATLDYNPLILDIIYAKVAENNTVLNDDLTLGGINATYELNADTVLEGFLFSKVRGSGATAVTNVDTSNSTSFAGTSTVKQKADVVNTIGARVVNKSLNNLSIDAQAAYQFGTYNPKFDPNAKFINAADKALTSPRSAWGTEIAATYNLKDLSSRIAKYEPSLTGAYVYLSGANREKTGSKAYKGWDSMFEDQTFGHLINATLGFSNVHLLGLSLKGKPTSDITAQLDYINGWFAKKYVNNTEAILSGVSGAQQYSMSDNGFLGNEIDITLTYDYTEDVQLSLLGGMFTPSSAINTVNTANGVKHNRASAVELIGSLRVTF